MSLCLCGSIVFGVPRSSSDDHGFEIVCGDGDGAAVAVAIVTLCKRDHFVVKGGAAVGRQSVEGSQRWAVVGAKEIHILLRRTKAKNGRAAKARDRRGAVGEKLAKM